MENSNKARDEPEKVQSIAIGEIKPFKDHPFQVNDDELMQQTIGSIMQVGVLNPVIIRPDPGGGYEMISGHRRMHAASLAGLDTIPAIVRNLADDEAIILMVDSNLQRETILPSERAKAYKMKLEAIKRQGIRNDLTCTQVGHKFDGTKSVQKIADDAGTSRSQVQRYIRLTELKPELQQMVDDGKIGLTPAVELSFLNQQEQEILIDTIDSEQATPSLSQAQRMKKLSSEGKLNDDTIHKILRSCFNQAVKWELMAKNPAANAMVPKMEYAKRDIWTAEMLFDALHVCDDPRLALALNLSFCCSLRMGEMLGLTWDCIDISDESISAGTPSVYVDKELQRVKRTVLAALDSKDVVVEFPATSSQTSTVLVLKKPKTTSSVRKVFMPKAVAQMLLAWKQSQDEVIELLGSEYQDYNLVFAGPLGLPTEGSTITGALKRLIKENDLPPVVFHSFRHASITYKLKLNGGDIKAVQGDSGHAQVKMVTDVYSHILDDDRKNNAQLFQEAFYDDGVKPEKPQLNLPEGLSQETLIKMLDNPEIVALLGALAKKL